MTLPEGTYRAPNSGPYSTRQAHHYFKNQQHYVGPRGRDAWDPKLGSGVFCFLKINYFNIGAKRTNKRQCVTLQMGYIDKPVDWLQYALKVGPILIFLIKLWSFKNWECAIEKSVTVIGFGRNRTPE
jgi:hypothetical protein